MSGRITADEASALREGITPGAWDAGAGLLYAGYDACPRHGVAPPDRTHGCTCRAIGDIYRDEDRALCAAAPDLAATVIAQAAEINAFKAQVDAQAVALRVVALWLGGPHHPSDAESVSSLARAKGDEIERLRAIIEGRTTPPTDAEIRDAARAGLTVILHAIDSRTGRIVDLRTRDVPLVSVWATHHAEGLFASAVWRLVDANDRPREWSVPSEPR